MEKNLYTAAQALQGELTENRRWLHAHAEVGFKVNETKSFIKEKLEEMGYTPQDCGKAGVLATLGGKNQQKAVLLRADMDALPMKEQTGLPFACKNGHMHACGHDLHAAMLLGAAWLLKEREKELPFSVKLLFQPAEEILQGASDCLQTGILEKPSVCAALTVHVTTGVPLPMGTVIVPAEGVGAPAADYFKVEMKGKACHGSAPQNGVDALTAAAHTLIALQEIQARELSSSTPAVLSVGTMQAGNAGNAIADYAVMEGTLRAFDEEVRNTLKKRVQEIAQGIAKTFRAKAKISFSGGCPTLVNDREICTILQKCAGQVLDERHVLSVGELGGEVKNRSGGSEDFAYISQKVPSAMMAIAAGEPKEGFSYPLHHPKVDFDERALPVGAAVFAAFALYGL